MKSRKIQNPVVWRMLVCFLSMTGIISVIAGYFAYQQKHVELVAELDKQLLQVVNEYRNITEDFWAIYLPIFEESQDSMFLSGYFSKEETAGLTPGEKLQLSDVLSHMALRDERVQWVAVYTPHRKVNYVYFPLGDALMELPDTFPYLEALGYKERRKEIYEETEVQIGGYQYRNIAIAGGAPGRGQGGSIVIGYDTGYLEQLCRMETGLKSLQFDIILRGKVIYSSGGRTVWPFGELETGTGGIYRVDGERWFVQISAEDLSGEKVCYSVKWSELFWNACGNITVVLGVTMLMAVLAVGIYFATIRSLTREVNVIRDGLDILGSNQLDYRIGESFNQPELAAIADAVNRMALRLRENIDRTHEYEQRQIKSELQELQAKFNPHFLYNTLEIFRARCYQNGDEETAELIAQTASIFRGFIGSRTFIPIQEELAFGKRYLALFKARYGDKVRILYDIDTEVLQYGIIRNVFQPLIENYFEHGYNPAVEENYILFRGRIRDEETLVFYVEDNGLGMSREELRELNNRLRQPIFSEKESYGLRNLHQRIRLFYGGECGLTVRPKEDVGLVIEMIIMRRRCSDAE